MRKIKNIILNLILIGISLICLTAYAQENSTETEEFKIVFPKAKIRIGGVYFTKDSKTNFSGEVSYYIRNNFWLTEKKNVLYISQHMLDGMFTRQEINNDKKIDVWQLSYEIRFANAIVEKGIIKRKGLGMGCGLGYVYAKDDGYKENAVTFNILLEWKNVSFKYVITKAEFSGIYLSYSFEIGKFKKLLGSTEL